MIEPSRIKNAFKRVEAENCALRTYLKNYANKNDFIKRYVNETCGNYQLNETPCCFLKKDGTCAIEICKPNSCRDYPYTDKPNRVYSLLSIIQSTSICPVVFELIERLKDEYNFKSNSDIPSNC